jgi:hypothetical protein
MHRRISHRALILFTPLLGALAFGAFPAIAGAATTPATPCTATSPSNPCYTTAPAIQPPAGSPQSEVTNPVVGIYLQGNPGVWNPAQPYPSVQWTQDCNPAAVPAVLGTPIAGAINRTYQITDADAGHTLCFIVDVSNGVEAIATPTGTVQPSAPIDQTAPTITGKTVQGDTLTATPGTWRGSGATTPGGITFTYQWKRCNSTGGVCGKAFTAPSSSPTYVLQSGDVGHTMQVLVTAKNSVGSTQAGAKKATAVVTAPPPSGGGSSGGNGGGGGGNGGGGNGGGGGGNGGSGNNGGGTNGGGTSGGNPPSQGGSSAAIRGLLMRALAANGKGAKIAALLAHGGYTFSFTAPSAGRLQILWFRTVHGKRILVATLTVTFHKAGKSKITLRLTRNGRNLLKHTRKLQLVASGGFTPAGHGTTNASRTITLSH